MTDPEWGVLSLGSNLGSSQKILTSAVSRLQALSLQPLKVSSLWKTEPIDCAPGTPDFLNLAIGLIPLLEETPESLLIQLRVIEKAFGRAPSRLRNQPRKLDIDLILFGSRQLVTEELEIPHPRAHERLFVIQPIAEIFPNLVFPGMKLDVSQMVQELSRTQTVSLLC
ncbi:MAG TPA: 2-amino-4-hydroxy-6-hydroxymethyldihydropteridine diphosphokinase [Verrucomicrobiales bacterium]|jgi:2-amino-4-hydroxy-6-hydroxymethyldihydropteridine diphosphokinase|nr:2-amino-4-hydroxy-6-hydroxymethyldihydropteridine diphosphokinase [Verrucomicrobiales bacterium]